MHKEEFLIHGENHRTSRWPVAEKMVPKTLGVCATDVRR